MSPAEELKSRKMESNTKTDLLSLVRRENESDQREQRDNGARDDEVEAVVETKATDMYDERDINVRIRTTLVHHFVTVRGHLYSTATNDKIRPNVITVHVYIHLFVHSSIHKFIHSLIHLLANKGLAASYSLYSCVHNVLCPVPWGTPCEAWLLALCNTFSEIL